jgi:predicted Zn-dependent protease
LIANVGLLLPYSRTQEYEADHIGLILMAIAGYDPHAALTFWEKMAQASKDKPAIEFLSTHPLDTHRIARIKALIPEAMRYYHPLPP